MTDFLQLLLSGVATGAIYAMAALGFTLLWQAAGTINFAQGEFVMLPAFAMLIGISFGLPLWASFIVAVALSILVLGAAFKNWIVDPMRGSGVVAVVVATLGLSIGLKSFVKAAYSAEPHPFPSIFGDEVFKLAGLTISYSDVGALVFAGLMVLGLQTFLNKTITGRAMQAVAQNTFSAEALGINVKRMIFYTFAINAILVAVTALLITPTYLATWATTLGSRRSSPRLSVASTTRVARCLAVFSWECLKIWPAHICRQPIKTASRWCCSWR
jgi:branched-chain amino acid transport system permease protein